MPEFRSRIDMYRWQTPAFSELFSYDSLLAPDESILETGRRTLERRFAELDCPLALTVDRVMPSYTCYIAESEQQLDIEKVQNAIYEIEGDAGWIIGFQLESSHSLRIFLRTDTHHPLNWKHVVTRITFRKTESPASFVAGVSLAQSTMIYDWAANQHLMITGSGGSKLSIIRNLILTAMMLNTPGEFRFALIGHGSDEYRILRDAPHALGHTSITKPEKGIRLLLGMWREVNRREAIFDRNDVDDFETCNIILEDDGKAALPRILLVLDTLNHVDWIKIQDQWLSIVLSILEKGARVGIHTVVTAYGLHLPYPFDEIADKIPNRLVTRSAASDTIFMDNVAHFHPSTMRFIDSFIVQDGEFHPIELPAIATSDIRAVISYWQENKSNRHDGINILNISSDGEDTVRKLVKELMDEQTNMSPPVPGKPSTQALARAAEVLAEDEVAEESFNISDQFATNGFKPLENPGELDINIQTIHRAQALATYLGWLGKGPLMDVLGLSVEESKAVIAILQARQILERGSNPTPHLHPSRRR